jgi:diacylglycerol kinase (ATP)
MKRIVAAFFHSLSAVAFGWRSETALREEMTVFVASLFVAPLLTLQPWKLAALWGSLLLLLAVEFLNTGIEKVADRVTRDRDHLVKVAKDCGSAAVLAALANAAMVWGIAVFERLAG